MGVVAGLFLDGTGKGGKPFSRGKSKDNRGVVRGALLGKGIGVIRGPEIDFDHGDGPRRNR